MQFNPTHYNMMPHDWISNFFFQFSILKIWKFNTRNYFKILWLQILTLKSYQNLDGSPAEKKEYMTTLCDYNVFMQMGRIKVVLLFGIY